MLERNQISASHEVIHQGRKMLVSELMQSLPPDIIAASRYVPAYTETYYYLLEPLLFGVTALTFINICVTVLSLFVTPMAGVMQCLTSPLHILCYIGYMVVFCIWVYRVHLNARFFGATDLYFTPAWAVAGWFIPVLSYFWPFMAVKEISQASKDPHNWRNQSATLVNVWWGFFILMCVIGISYVVSFFLLNSSKNIFQDPALMRINQIYSIPLNVFNIMFSLLTWLVIRSIHTHQSYLIKNGKPMPAEARNILSM